MQTEHQTEYRIEATITRNAGKYAQSQTVTWSGEDWREDSSNHYTDRAEAILEFESLIEGENRDDWAGDVKFTLTAEEPVLDQDGDLMDIKFVTIREA